MVYALYQVNVVVTNSEFSGIPLLMLGLSWSLLYASSAISTTSANTNVAIMLVCAGVNATALTALEAPDEIRQSRIDPQVLLFYKAEATKRWTCAVAKQVGEGAFLVTAYPTDAIKEGVRIWPK